MDPTKFKEIARQFTTKYYPQLLPRVDRIWDMLNEIDFSKKPGTVSQIGGGFAFAGEANPELQGMISGIAVIAFTYQGVKDDGNISEADLKNRINTTCLNLKTTSDLQAKLENVLSEILPSLAGNAIIKEKEKPQFAKLWTKDSGQEGKFIDEQEFNELFARKANYEIFIVDRGEYDMDSVGEVHLNNDIILMTNSSTSKRRKNHLTSPEYKLLVFTLQNNYRAGHIVNMVENCYGKKNEAEDLRAISEAKDTDKFGERTSNYRRTISNLSKLLSDKIKVKIRSFRTGSYVMTGKPSFCLIMFL